MQKGFTVAQILEGKEENGKNKKNKKVGKKDEKKR